MHGKHNRTIMVPWFICGYGKEGSLSFSCLFRTNAIRSAPHCVIACLGLEYLLANPRVLTARNQLAR